jgi:hypothetical protein
MNSTMVAYGYPEAADWNVIANPRNKKQATTTEQHAPLFNNDSRETYVWENASAIAARSQVRARFDWRNIAAAACS